VDFVDAGDNKRADVLLFKHKDGLLEHQQPLEHEAGAPGILKRLLTWIAKAAGAPAEELDAALAAVEKDATTFDEKLVQRQRRQAADEIWDYCWMLNDSLCSIFWDDEVPDGDKGAKMETSVDEFVVAVKAAIPKWVEGTLSRIAKEQVAITPERLELAKRTYERLGELIAKAESEAPAGETETPPGDGEEKTIDKEGVLEDMKIDKSKLTPEEVAALEAIEKKAGIPDEPPAGGDTPLMPASVPEPAPTAKAATVPAPAAPVADDGGEDIYKGLHPTVRAELECLRKQVDAAEERELQEVAKKYEIIGKKAEELVPLLKSLKAAGGDAYAQMITVLDASVAAVEKSGLFTEIGKSGGAGASGADSAWTQIEKHAEAIQKAAPTMTWAEAVDKACEQHPDLVHEYENGR
jgi:hypothetical protein